MTLSDTSPTTLLRALRQIRQLRPNPIPAHVMHDILEVGRWTGSARNLQPWDFVVVEDRQTLQRLATVEGSYAAHLANAGAGLVLVISRNTQNPQYDTYDEGRLSERIMLAAAAHGYGSAIGWLTGPAEDEVKTLLGIPRPRLVRSVVSIGEVDRDAHGGRKRPAQPRKPLESIVHRERW